MPKAKITLANGTEVVIEGSVEEVNQLLVFYSQQKKDAPRSTGKTSKKRIKKSSGAGEPSKDLSEIINVIKNCDEAAAIESTILDKSGQVERILLPLYIVHEHLDNEYALTSGDINKITTDLGVPISTPNISRVLSGTARSYVIGDKIRRKGSKVNYRLSRKGVQYLGEVIASGEDK